MDLTLSREGNRNGQRKRTIVSQHYYCQELGKYYCHRSVFFILAYVHVYGIPELILEVIIGVSEAGYMTIHDKLYQTI